MANDYIAKLKQLSPALQAKLSEESFLLKLDEMEEQYGVKTVLILINLLLGEIDYGVLAEKLQADYGLNDFLAEEIKGKFGDLIKILGAEETKSQAQPARPEPKSIAKMPMPVFTPAFSREDEEEVKKYANVSPAMAIDYSALAEKIMSAFGYQPTDVVMIKRLHNIIVARIRDVRDDLETRENLIKSKKVGGMELAEKDADRLLALINNKPASGKLVSADAQPKIEMEDGLPVVRMPQAMENKPMAKQDYKSSGLPEPADDVKMIAEVREKIPSANPQPYIAEKRIPESVLNAKTAQRPNLDDVKLEKRLAGPIDELETMTIIDFRRLAADPQAAVNKIKEKIDLLEADSFNQRIAGTVAWQKNEVSRFYRLLGHLAMTDNKNIEDVIKERLMSGKPTLSLDEFHAVMELNRALRY